MNADDLGYDPEIDRGILEAHERGIVSSATAMVETPFSADALGGAPRSLGIGLHVVLDPSIGTASAEASLRRQLARFGELRGAPPTHLDGHRHVHAAPAILAAFVAVARAEGLPVRSVDRAMREVLRAQGIATPDRLLGDATLRPAWTETALVEALGALPDGATEIMAHPGHAPRHATTSFGAEREVELAALCSPRVRRALTVSGAILCGYAEAASAGRP